MVLILNAANSASNAGRYVAEGLKRLNLEAVCYSDPGDIGDVSQYEAVFFSGEFPACSEDCENAAREVCKAAKSLEIPVIFDPELRVVAREKYALINEFAALSEIFLPGAEDATALCGLEDPEEIAAHYLALGTQKIVIKLDKKGAYFKSAKENGYAPTFRADRVIDTHGAGDAFAAGLISGVTEEIPLGEAVVRANACGCIAIQTEGETNCFPTADRLREYMLNHRFAVDGCKDY